MDYDRIPVEPVVRLAYKGISVTPFTRLFDPLLFDIFLLALYETGSLLTTLRPLLYQKINCFTRDP